MNPPHRPNRWETPVTVEVIHLDMPSTFKTFSDLQLAYLWIQSQCSPATNDIYISTFHDTCAELDFAYFRMGLRGSYCVAQNLHAQYIVYYGILTI